jgi:hypothetical protein
MHASQRRDPRDTPPGADDHRAIHTLAQDAIGRAHVIGALGGDRRGLQAKPGVANRPCGVLHHRVAPSAAVLQGQVEALDLKLQREHLRGKHVQGLFQELLPRLIPVEHNDLQRVTHSSIPPWGSQHSRRDSSLCVGSGTPDNFIRLGVHKIRGSFRHSACSGVPRPSGAGDTCQPRVSRGIGGCVFVSDFHEGTLSNRPQVLQGRYRMAWDRVGSSV